jgi:hypothetical protein
MLCLVPSSERYFCSISLIMSFARGEREYDLKKYQLLLRVAEEAEFFCGKLLSCFEG